MSFLIKHGARFDISSEYGSCLQIAKDYLPPHIHSQFLEEIKTSHVCTLPNSPFISFPSVSLSFFLPLSLSFPLTLPLFPLSPPSPSSSLPPPSDLLGKLITFLLLPPSPSSSLPPFPSLLLFPSSFVTSFRLILVWDLGRKNFTEELLAHAYRRPHNFSTLPENLQILLQAASVSPEAVNRNFNTSLRICTFMFENFRVQFDKGK